MSDKSVVYTLVLSFVYLHKSEPGAVQLNNTRRLLRMGVGVQVWQDRPGRVGKPWWPSLEGRVSSLYDHFVNFKNYENKYF
jgi:hypothetical protein